MLASLSRVVCVGSVAVVQFCNHSVFVIILVDIEKLLTLTRPALWAGGVGVSRCSASMAEGDGHRIGLKCHFCVYCMTKLCPKAERSVTQTPVGICESYVVYSYKMAVQMCVLNYPYQGL